MQPSYTDWTLVSLSPLSRTSLTLAVIAVLLAAAWVIIGYRGAKRPLLLMAVRALAALLIIGFLVEPALQLRLVRKIKNRVAIVVDRSRSMTLATAEGNTRYDTVLAALKADRDGLERLGESHLIDWFDLEGPVAPAVLDAPPAAERTDLLTALEVAREAGGGKPLAGLVLMSDGADNAGLDVAGGGELAPEARARLARLGVPVNTIYAGGSGFRDIAIADVRGDEFAFVHNTFEIEVVIDATGFEGATVPVTLKREGEAVATQSVVLGQEHTLRVGIKSKPDKIGEFVYSVEVPVLAGEAVTSNNQRSFVLSVIRDKIRVLQVAGRPSWDERFLRQHLKENPNVDLISFFILRTPTDTMTVREEELSLIPFPVEKLFTTELRTFDVVILQNFDYRPYHMQQYLPNIRDAVTRNGLGFVMIGGDQSFAGGGYVGTDLEDLLPLVPSEAGMLVGRITPALTEAGRSHPVTDLTRGAGANDAAWRQLSAWTSANRTGGLAPGASALVVDGASVGNGTPLVAVMDAGVGRSMAIATDSMWRWRFSSTKDGGASERAYHRFWSNALRWLVRDPEHSRIRVTPDRRRFEIGASVDVTVTVLGQDYRPVPAAAVRLALSSTETGTLRLEDVTTGDTGSVRHRYENLTPGAYRVQAEASASGAKLGDGQGVFVVESRSIELSRGMPRPDLLALIAKETGGKAVQMEAGFSDKLTLGDPDVIEVDRRRNVELWDNGWALVVGAILLAADWALRRRRGYL